MQDNSASPVEHQHAAPSVEEKPSRAVRLFRAARRKWLKWTLISLAAVVVAIAAFLSLTAIGRYLARAGWEEAKILWRRRPITEMIADASVDSLTRRKLRIVLEARRYAEDSLGLDVEESFTTFSQLERDTLVLVLSAAYRDRLQHHRWWFPVVGRVPYKGFFDYGMARAEELEFQRRGFDTYLRPASAFSTLGWFNDPLMSTTLRADTLALANTVVHELVHNTFYANGKAEFNESFANFVGARGSADFFRSRGHERAVAEAEARWSDEKLLARFWKTLHQDIDSVFSAHPGEDNKRLRLALRDSIFRMARLNLVHRLGPQLRTTAPRYLERVRLDNAALMARRIYLTDLDLFDSVWVRERRLTRNTIHRIIAVARENEGVDPYEALRRWLTATRTPHANSANRDE
jgi:predicted aminopeptidase